MLKSDHILRYYVLLLYLCRLYLWDSWTVKPSLNIVDGFCNFKQNDM